MSSHDIISQAVACSPLSSIIMEVENGSIWKVTTIGGPVFHFLHYGRKGKYTLLHRMTSLHSVCSLHCFCCEESLREPSFKFVNLQLEGNQKWIQLLVISNCFGSSLLDPIWPLENLSKIRHSSFQSGILTLWVCAPRQLYLCFLLALMPWKVPILNVVDAFTTALIETLLALFLSGSGEVEGLSDAIEAWQFPHASTWVEGTVQGFATVYHHWVSKLLTPRVAPIQILNNLVESHALHSKGLEPKVSAVMILTSHTGGCPSHIDYILDHTATHASDVFGEPRMLWSHGSISPSLGFVPLQPCWLL